MTDLRLALQAAAPAPVRALDMAAVHRRARTGGVRRAVAWIAGASALIVAGAGVGNGVLVNAGRGGGNGGGRDAAGQHTPVVGFEEVGRDTAPARDAPGGRATSGARRATTAARHGAAAPAPPRASDYPVRGNCSVDTAGLAVGEERACRFTATDAGYASIDSTSPAETNNSVEQFAHGEVYVTHNGVRRLAWSSDQCGPEVHVGMLKTFYSDCKGTIMDGGDYVEVKLTKKGDDGFVVTLYAGKDAPA